MSSTVTAITVTVSGMTCGGCANKVRGAVESLPGVTDVEVDLATGTVTVDGDASVERDTVTAAVTELGYRVAE
ncbi:heavy metal-associated domain-containing protein [Nocardia sp. NPDC052566]|uniref:heavy metal-associated domain-containing protein n=1 Tax=Nocardia sp. NPDC052566 TaxID=3364330 RepID=UPI0037C9B145